MLGVEAGEGIGSTCDCGGEAANIPFAGATEAGAVTTAGEGEGLKNMLEVDATGADNGDSKGDADGEDTGEFDGEINTEVGDSDDDDLEDCDNGESELETDFDA